MTKHHAFVRSLAAATMLCLGLTSSPPPADAHPMPQTLVLLDARNDGIDAELRLPTDRLEIGFGQPLLGNITANVARHRDSLIAYVRRHISATSAEGREWTSRVVDLGIDGTDTLHVIAHVQLRAPAGVSARTLVLRYDVIQHLLVTHVILVSIRSDWTGGELAGTPRMLGTMGYAATSLAIDLPPGTAWSGVISVVRLGMRHIAEGTDHLLFLLVLLLPACLIARGSRWREYAGPWRSVGRLVAIVTAFTVGHSLTLAVGSFGWFNVPNQPVEVLIAVSILVSAVHAVRPLFPGRESWIAGSFGLVHGLAFASVMSELRLDAAHTAMSIFAFNVGIEIMQLMVVVATVPWLLLLARTGAYAPVRIVGAVGAIIVAAAWVAERAAGVTNPFTPAVNFLADHAVACLGALVFTTVSAVVVDYRRHGPARAIATPEAKDYGTSLSF
jgi:hypothetical protein